MALGMLGSNGIGGRVRLVALPRPLVIGETQQPRAERAMESSCGFRTARNYADDFLIHLSPPLQKADKLKAKRAEC